MSAKGEKYQSKMAKAKHEMMEGKKEREMEYGKKAMPKKKAKAKKKK